MIDYSIITVCYEDRKGLIKTIKSVITQSYTNYEFLVIDGDSNDGTKDILDKYNKYFSYCVSEPDTGIYNAMNKGISHAQGKYFIFMNAGDVFHSKTVLQDVSNQLDDKDIVSGYALKNGKDILNLHENNVLMMLLHSTFSHQATFIKSELFKDYRYDETLRFVADWKAWVDWIVLNDKTYKYIDTIVSDYDFSGISSVSSNWQKILDERQRVLKDSFTKPVLDNLMHFHEIYLETHYKYICSKPLVKKISFFFLKTMALLGKLISKNPNEE